jgi:uncharacterized protein (DUF1778 family)
MPRSSVKKTSRQNVASPLMVRLDEDSKNVLAQAAQLRRISVSDYVRAVTVGQARREVASAQERTIVLTPDEQLAFWRALEAPAKATPAQRRLGKLMSARPRTPRPLYSSSSS